MSNYHLCSLESSILVTNAGIDVLFASFLIPDRKLGSVLGKNPGTSQMPLGRTLGIPMIMSQVAEMKLRKLIGIRSFPTLALHVLVLKLHRIFDCVE